MGAKFGFELLTAQVVGEAEWRAEIAIAEAPGDSQIERLLWAAIVLGADAHIGPHELIDGVLSPKDEDTERSLMTDFPRHLIIRSQAQVRGHRVDFLVTAPAARNHQLVVECDGHAFHERTKEQAAADRSRDRNLTLAGYTVMRFTGSELWRDPSGCARQVFDWVSAS